MNFLLRSINTLLLPTVFPFRLKLGVFLHGNLTGAVPPNHFGSSLKPPRFEATRVLGAHLRVPIGALLQTWGKRWLDSTPGCVGFGLKNPRATNQKQPSAWLWAFDAWPWGTPDLHWKALWSRQVWIEWFAADSNTWWVSKALRTLLQKQSGTRRFSNINNKSSLDSHKKNQWHFWHFVAFWQILEPTKSSVSFTRAPPSQLLETEPPLLGVFPWLSPKPPPETLRWGNPTATGAQIMEGRYDR